MKTLLVLSGFGLVALLAAARPAVAQPGQAPPVVDANTPVEVREEEYGYLAVYMRLKGIVPPSSEPAPAPVKK